MKMNKEKYIGVRYKHLTDTKLWYILCLALKAEEIDGRRYS